VFLARLEAALEQLGKDRQRVELVPFSPELPALSFEAAERAIVCPGAAVELAGAVLAVLGGSTRR
jgi:hypothetical protein